MRKLDQEETQYAWMASKVRANAHGIDILANSPYESSARVSIRILLIGILGISQPTSQTTQTRP